MSARTWAAARRSSSAPVGTELSGPSTTPARVSGGPAGPVVMVRSPCDGATRASSAGATGAWALVGIPCSGGASRAMSWWLVAVGPEARGGGGKPPEPPAEVAAVGWNPEAATGRTRGRQGIAMGVPVNDTSRPGRIDGVDVGIEEEHPVGEKEDIDTAEVAEEEGRGRDEEGAGGIGGGAPSTLAVSPTAPKAKWAAVEDPRSGRSGDSNAEEGKGEGATERHGGMIVVVPRLVEDKADGGHGVVGGEAMASTPTKANRGTVWLPVGQNCGC